MSTPATTGRPPEKASEERNTYHARRDFISRLYLKPLRKSRVFIVAIQAVIDRRVDDAVIVAIDSGYGNVVADWRAQPCVVKKPAIPNAPNLEQQQFRNQAPLIAR